MNAAPKSFREYQAEDRRLVILRLLAESSGYKATAYVLQPALDACGHPVSHDQVNTDMAWLAEQGLIYTEAPAGITIATLTTRGLDVSAGRANVPGVKKPLPG